MRLAGIEKDAVNMTVAEALQAQRLYEEAGIKEARKIRVRIQEKFTVPMACLVLACLEPPSVLSPVTAVAAVSRSS